LIARLKLLPGAPCIILAVGQVDEDLWHHAINQQVYDVVWRTGHNHHLMATLEFAWKWRTDCRVKGSGRLHGAADNRELALPVKQSTTW
jgi:hypothetical protein